MAFGWLGALKAIPWSDVVAAAPAIVRGAKHLYDSAQSRRTGAPGPDGRPAASTAERLQAAEAEIAALKAEQAATGEVVRSLAEHNARLVDAVARLQVRTRITTWLCGALVVAVAGLVVWALAR